MPFFRSPSERNPDLTQMDGCKTLCFGTQRPLPMQCGAPRANSPATLPNLDITNSTRHHHRRSLPGNQAIGASGSFAVAYKVFDILGGVERVLKLNSRSPLCVRAPSARIQNPAANSQEFHVVDVIWAGSSRIRPSSSLSM